MPRALIRAADVPSFYPIEITEPPAHHRFVHRNLSSPLPPLPSPNPVEAIVARQLEAYNAQDLETFVNCFSVEVEIIRDGDDQPQRGRDLMRRNYAAMFARFPDNHCTLLQRMVVGSHAVDEELIEGRDGAPFRTIAVYTIQDGLIHQVRFLSCEVSG